MFFYVAWGCGFACMMTMCFLQGGVLTSPQVATAEYIHPVSYKGGTFYLAEPLFALWTTLEAMALPLFAVCVLLIFACNTLEHRVKRPLWEKGIGDLLERGNGPDGGNN
jgi:hypothetical protein